MGSLKEIETGYDRFWESLVTASDNWSASSRSLRRRAVDFVPHNENRVLDIGCGMGAAMDILSRVGIQVTGIDISSVALRKASEFGEVIKADVTNLPVRSNEFSYVLLLDVLEHVVDKESLVNEVLRVLQQNGIAVLTTPLPRATDGHGDVRQPYDRPSELTEITNMTAGRFDVLLSCGIGWAPRFMRIAEFMIPAEALGALFSTFPFLLRRSSEILLILKKTQ